MSSKDLGNFGERTANDFLKKGKYKILEKNFKRKWGEIDIVGKKKNKIIFFEVKTIIENKNFFPEDQITAKKKKQLLKMSQIYLSEKKLPFNTPRQIDIIAIEVSPKNEVMEIRHHKNAIEDIH